MTSRSRSWLPTSMDSLRVLRHRNYAIFIAGNLVALTGQWMQRIALAWLIWELTQSTLWLGLLSAADLLPATLIGLVGGVIADRVNRYGLVMSCYAATTVVAVMFGVLQLTGNLNPVAILILAFIQGVTSALSHPARLAIVQSLVPAQDSGKAVTVGAITINMARLIGPAIGGWLILYFGIGWVFFLCAFMQAVFIVCFMIVPDPQQKMAPGSSSSILGEIKEGISHLWTIAMMPQVLLFLLMSGIMLRSMVELVPAFAARSFAVSAVGVAIMSSTMAAGAVLGGLTFSPGRDPLQLTPKIMVCWMFSALAVCCLALSTIHLAAVLSVSVLGFFMTRGMIITQTYIQLTVLDRMRGRAVSIFALLSRGSPLFGALLIGAIADSIGLEIPVLGSGLIMLFASFFAWRRTKAKTS